MYTGQYFDLLNIFNLNGYPSATHAYLFNGDFVDRGSWSCEIALLLYSYKWLYPSTFFLNRGNHETDDMNRMVNTLFYPSSIKFTDTRKVRIRRRVQS